jgi:hypothetical protein
MGSALPTVHTLRGKKRKRKEKEKKKMISKYYKKSAKNSNL